MVIVDYWDFGCNCGAQIYGFYDAANTAKIAADLRTMDSAIAMYQA